MKVNMTYFLLGILCSPWLVDATSFKMDFLSSGAVRTDPLMFSQIGNCLSDHVHRFYGATSSRTMRPDVTYQDLRRAKGNTGNVEENKSLYWNPAIYQIKNPNGDKTFELVDIWFASAYYLFRTNQAKAFPNGLKMKAFGDNKLSRVTAICDGPYPCERDDAGGCNAYGPSNQAQNGFLPVTGCNGMMYFLFYVLTLFHCLFCRILSVICQIVFQNLKLTSNFQRVGTVKTLNLPTEVMLPTALTVTGTNITSVLILIVLRVIQ